MNKQIILNDAIIQLKLSVEDLRKGKIIRF